MRCLSFSFWLEKCAFSKISVYLWWCWVPDAVRGHFQMCCPDFSLWRLLSPHGVGSGAWGHQQLGHVEYKPVCSPVCGVLPDQGSNLGLLVTGRRLLHHWAAREARKWAFLCEAVSVHSFSQGPSVAQSKTVRLAAQRARESRWGGLREGTVPLSRSRQARKTVD